VETSNLSAALKPAKSQDSQGRPMFVQSDAFRILRKLWKLKIMVQHRNKMQEQKIYTIDQIMHGSSYGEEGAISTAVTFDKKLPDGTTRKTSVFQHYQDTYGFRLHYPRLPIIKTTRGGLFPMELCNVAKNQRYPFKLDSAQVSGAFSAHLVC
jgi:eukaryotic translation initiation factor 2C